MMNLYIIGIGGRTGAMFARELRDVAHITGVGLPDEVAAIAAGRIKIKRAKTEPEVFEVDAVAAKDFGQAIAQKYPDLVWMAVKNPVRLAVEYYYRHFAGQEKIPPLILSQNGLSAVDDARQGLAAALGNEAEKVRIIRVALMNGIDLKEEAALPSPAEGNGQEMGHDQPSVQAKTWVIHYKLPVKLGFGSVDGRDDSELEKLFWDAKFSYQPFGGEAAAMENAKLFLNLIGMASAANGLGVSAGLRHPLVFKEEIAALKEFALAVKKSGRNFPVEFCGYPIGRLLKLTAMPPALLLPFRSLIESAVNKGRNRPKDLSEIDYYNGEVVRLGKAAGVPTPANENIVAKAKRLLNSKS